MTWAPSKQEGVFSIKDPGNTEERCIAVEAKCNTEGPSTRKVGQSRVGGRGMVDFSGGMCVFEKEEEKDDLRART